MNSAQILVECLSEDWIVADVAELDRLLDELDAGYRGRDTLVIVSRTPDAEHSVALRLGGEQLALGSIRNGDSNGWDGSVGLLGRIDTSYAQPVVVAAAQAREAMRDYVRTGRLPELVEAPVGHQGVPGRWSPSGRGRPCRDRGAKLIPRPRVHA